MCCFWLSSPNTSGPVVYVHNSLEKFRSPLLSFHLLNWATQLEKSKSYGAFPLWFPQLSWTMQPFACLAPGLCSPYGRLSAPAEQLRTVRDLSCPKTTPNLLPQLFSPAKPFYRDAGRCTSLPKTEPISIVLQTRLAVELFWRRLDGWSDWNPVIGCTSRSENSTVWRV